VHDRHNLLVVGIGDAAMAIAANKVIEIDGGLAIVADGEVKASVVLPVAGLMGTESCAAVGAKVREFEDAIRPPDARL
jgi:adenine deaminase